MMTANTKMMTVKEQNKALSQTSVMPSTVTVNEFLKNKGIEYPSLIVDKYYKTHSLHSLIAEYYKIMSDDK